jgi:hypothetical protein
MVEVCHAKNCGEAAMMVQARIEQGRVEVREPIPPEWEGQLVKITTLTPDDPLPDLEERLAALHALGPMEFEPGEGESIARALAELNSASKAAMEAIPGVKPRIKYRRNIGLASLSPTNAETSLGASQRLTGIACRRDCVFLNGRRRGILHGGRQ